MEVHPGVHSEGERLPRRLAPSVKTRGMSAGRKPGFVGTGGLCYKDGRPKHSDYTMSQREKTAAPVIVLAMHGAPALDFPGDELTEFFTLHARVGHGSADQEALRKRYEELEARVRAWPRTSGNDPFYAGSIELTDHLRRKSGLEVIVGFNEFCSPSLAEAIDRAVRSADKVLVITPMMTRGGEHSTVDIPEAISAARQRHPGKDILYVWPFPIEDIARFLSEQISRLL